MERTGKSRGTDLLDGTVGEVTDVAADHRFEAGVARLPPVGMHCGPDVMLGHLHTLAGRPQPVDPRLSVVDEAGPLAVEVPIDGNEVLDLFRSRLGVSPKVKQHLANSRIEVLKAIRAVIDERIEHLSKPAQQGTKIQVE